MSLCILFIFFSHPCFFSPLFANETSMVRHMWSLFAWPRCSFRAICWGHSPKQSHPESEGDIRRNLWHHGRQEMVSYRLGALICSFQKLGSAVTPLMQVPVWHRKATAPQNSQELKEKSHQISSTDLATQPFLIFFFFHFKEQIG